MFMEERTGKRINAERTDEAESTGADTLGVACPYCLIMLDDGAKGKGGQLQVLDVAQIVDRATGTKAAVAAAPEPGPGSPPAGGAADGPDRQSAPSVD